MSVRKSHHAVKDVLDAYAGHARAVDREFRAEYQIYRDRMKCGRGCSMCCSQMFSISEIEAAYISAHVKQLSASQRSILQSKARKYISDAKTLTGVAACDDSNETLTPRPGLRLPCPALENDACSIYEARPIICRKWGIPVFNPAKPMELQACELNFRPGEEVEVDEIIEPQAKLLEDWVMIKQRAGKALGRKVRVATIAEAIVYDYEAALGGEPLRPIE